MRFSIMLPSSLRQPMMTHPWEDQLTCADLQRVVRTADELGFDAVTVPEHFVVPRSMHAMDSYHVHALTGMAFVAGATQHIAVNSLVMVLPLHNAVELAKAISTLDRLSGGRVMCTFGAGYTPEEFAAVGAEYARRGQVCDEYLAAMLELWTKEDPEFKGEFVSFSDIAFEPKCAGGRVPTIWLGGDALPALRRAARFGDGWSPWKTPLERIPERVAYIKEQPEFVARPRPFDVQYSLNAAVVGDDHGTRKDQAERVARIAGSREELVDALGHLAEHGVTWTWIPQPPLPDLEAYLDNLRWQAEEVIPHVR